MPGPVRVSWATLLGLLSIVCLHGCAPADNGEQTGDATRELTVALQADFAASALDATARLAPESGAPTRVDACPTPAAGNDFPGLPAGSDCDADGAGVAYITPSEFLVAIKRLTLIDSEERRVDIIPDTERLINARVIDLTELATLDPAALSPARYVQLEAEFYYFELLMPLNSPAAMQRLRMYLSDDDFSAEGNAGHHQGDITLLDAAGHELGFVVEGAAWTVAELSPVHQDMVYAGSTDPETGHRRGPFGDTGLWNSTAFMQGASQDVFVTTLPLNLDLTAQSATLNIVFSVAESWFYEDFDNDGLFAPCAYGQGNPGDACFDGGGWAALFPAPELHVVQQTSTGE